MAWRYIASPFVRRPDKCLFGASEHVHHNFNSSLEVAWLDGFDR
jgi:hypothetical protein